MIKSCDMKPTQWKGKGEKLSHNDNAVDNMYSLLNNNYYYYCGHNYNSNNYLYMGIVKWVLL